MNAELRNEMTEQDTLPSFSIQHSVFSISSDRFVLSADAPYLANLAALWAVDHKLAARIEATHGLESYPVQLARSGAATVAVPPGGYSAPRSRGGGFSRHQVGSALGAGSSLGATSSVAAEATTPAVSAPVVAPDVRAPKPILLHSRYDPVDEARRLIASVDVEKNVGFFIHGFALGYHVEALFERAGGTEREGRSATSSQSLFFVFEPDLLLLRTAFEQRDHSRLIESRRVLFFTEADKPDLIARLTPHTAMLSLGTATVEHPPSLQIAPEFHGLMRNWLDEFASFARTSLNTVLLNSMRTAENIARNAGWYAAAACPSRLRDRFAGKPAIVVSAGPSLRKNKHLLKDAAGRAVLIAVQTTLQPLLDMGVEPHFVTSLDYHEISTRFYENLPKQIRTELVAEPKATSRIFDMNPGPLTLLGNDYAEGLLREMKVSKATLPAGATVAHLAYYLAEHMGCDPVIFVGQDLGFSDGLCYSPGTSYEDVWRPEVGRFCSMEMKQWDQIVRERFILRRVPDYQGRPMYTEERLFTYLQQFEADFLRSKRKIIDASEGGAAKRGATAMPLAEALHEYCGKPLEVDLSDHPGADWGRSGEVIACLVRRRDEAAVVEEISRETLPLLEEIRDFCQDQERANQAISKIDALRARMNDLGATYDLIAQLTQKSQLDRFEADCRIAAARLDDLERQRRQVERDILNVQAMLEASQRFQELMDEVIGKLSARVPEMARAEAA
jgi:hypothetical protein